MASWGPDATKVTSVIKNNNNDSYEEEKAIEEGLDINGGKVYALRFDDSRLVSGQEDGRLHVLDFSPQALMHKNLSSSSY